MLSTKYAWASASWTWETRAARTPKAEEAKLDDLQRRIYNLLSAQKVLVKKRHIHFCLPRAVPLCQLFTPSQSQSHATAVNHATKHVEQ